MHIGKFLGNWFTKFHNVFDRKQFTTPVEVDDWSKANLIGSKAVGINDHHYPAIDIDWPCMLLESTNGNGHLLIKAPLTTEQYDKLLKVMTEIGLYNQGCYDFWKQEGITCVRVPWVEKQPEDRNS